MKRTLTIFLVLALLLTAGIPASAGATGAGVEPAGYVTISLDVNTLGAGFLYEPARVPFYEGENYAQVTDRFLGEENYTHGGSLESGYYINTVLLPRDIVVDIPAVILDVIGEEIGEGPSAQGEYLGEFDYYGMAGWMYTVNHVFAPMGAADWYPEDGDVCRWQFTVYGWGADLGVPNDWGGEPLYEGANRDALTAAVGAINSAPNKSGLLARPGVLEAYGAANAVLTNLTAAQSEVDGALAALENALNAAPPSVVDISTELNATLALLLNQVPEPSYGTSGGEWTVLTLARAGYSVPADYYSKYYSAIESIVTENEGVLPSSQNKKTEYSRLIMALSAIGKDSTAVAGYDLTAWLSGMSPVTKQGINGPIFALIALDTNGYEIPDIEEVAALTGYTGGAADQATRQKFIQYILDKEIKKGTAEAGGWALFGNTPDPDITAMALQALAPYLSDGAVAAAVERAVTALSTIQREDGGFDSWGTVNPESCAQVVVALTALGIDPVADSRFVKNGNSVVSALLKFYVEGGGFKHTADGSLDGMATDQAGYALVAYDRFVKGENRLYDMSDAFTPVAGEGVTCTDKNGTGTTVTAGEGVLPPGTELIVNLITSGSDYEKTKIALQDESGQFTLFDISLLLDGAEIQPDGKITVSIPLPEGYDGAKCKVYRLEADGTLTEINTVFENGYLVFETDHFSLYAVAQALAGGDGGDKNGQKGDGSASQKGDDSSKKKGDGLLPQSSGSGYSYAPAVLLLLALGMLVISNRKKRQLFIG